MSGWQWTTRRCCMRWDAKKMRGLGDVELADELDAAAEELVVAEQRSNLIDLYRSAAFALSSVCALSLVFIAIEVFK